MCQSYLKKVVFKESPWIFSCDFLEWMLKVHVVFCCWHQHPSEPASSFALARTPSLALLAVPHHRGASWRPRSSPRSMCPDVTAQIRLVLSTQSLGNWHLSWTVHSPFYFKQTFAWLFLNICSSESTINSKRRRSFVLFIAVSLRQPNNEAGTQWGPRIVKE